MSVESVTEPLRQVRRSLACLVLAAGLLLGPVAAMAAAADQTAPPPETAADSAAGWAVTISPGTLRAGPADDAPAFSDVPSMTLFQVLTYSRDYAYVADPRTRETAYIRSDLLGPSDPPSRYVTMPAPAATDEFDTRGVVTDWAPLAVFPTPSEEAEHRELDPNTWLRLTGSVLGEDGSTWYRTQDGAYVPSDAVFVPDRVDSFPGRWLSVRLSTPTTVTAMEGETPVRSFLAIRGAGPRPTPTGTFTILRRVANETMNSDTIGIPRFGPGGYYLTNVLFTQYFTSDGASLHYNYWSSHWGLPGSHGCLGLTYNDSAWLWSWARVGTPVMINP
jgi:L,D-transpeptidase catalytic domain